MNKSIVQKMDKKKIENKKNESGIDVGGGGGGS